jgi:hypothetical protein
MGTTPYELPAPACARCTHFDNDPGALEAAFPGMRAMGSGFSSVRDSDGICRRHGIYLAATDSCPEFQLRTSGRAGARI